MIDSSWKGYAQVVREQAAEIQTLKAREGTAFEAIRNFLAVWDEVEPKINGIIGLQAARSGFTWQYDGKPLPIKELRDAYTAYQAHAQA